MICRSRRDSRLCNGVFICMRVHQGARPCVNNITTSHQNNTTGPARQPPTVWSGLEACYAADAVRGENQRVGVGVALGMTFGIVIGAATDNLGAWLAIGLALGAALGAASEGGSRSGGSDAP